MGQGERGNRILRNFDKWLGIPLALVLGALRRKRFLPKKIESIALFMFGAIGDSLIASAVISDLKQHFPQAKIIGFVSFANRAVVDLFDGLDEVILVPVAHPLKAVQAVRSRPIDILIDFGQWARVTAMLAALAKAKFTVGFHTVGQRRHFAYDTVACHRNDQHELDNFRDLVRCLGVKPTGRPHLQSSLSGVVPPSSLKQPYVVFHPWASGYRHHFREWPLINWIALGQILLANNYMIAISGGPKDRNKSMALAEAIGGSKVHVLAGTPSLLPLVAILNQADAVISVNTGVMHLAATLDRPLVALHGPTNPLRWGPLSARAIVLGPGPEQGGAYLHLGFEYPAAPPDCMKLITVKDVMESLQKLLGNIPAGATLAGAAGKA